MLRIISKFVFICNLCFLATFVIQWVPHFPESELVSIVIILGYVVAILVNIIVNTWYAILLVSGKQLRNIVPVWLIITNFLFLISQLILFLK